MTVADILIVALFLYCDMERYETNAISVCLLCMDTIYMWVVGCGVYLYNALYFGDAWLPKSKSLSQKGSAKNVLHCPILFLCEAWALVCLQRNVSFCSARRQFILGAYSKAFASLFLSKKKKKKGYISKVAQQGRGLLSFFSSIGMVSFAVITPNIWPVITCIVPVDLGWLT